MPVTFDKQYLIGGMSAVGIPSHMWEGLAAYILHGLPTGHFLTAVLSNDLREAVNRADKDNIKALPAYVKFLYNDAPAGCWGSEDKVESWIKRRGLNGITRKEGA